jgi:hygromycin-B 7''-O-kinase
MSYPVPMTESPGPLLPAVDTLDALQAFLDDPTVWTPAVRVICQRHGLPPDQIERARYGGNLVVFLAGDLVLKLIGPKWRMEYESERAGLDRVSGRLPVATPDLVATGEIEGWPYLLMRRVPGVELRQVWARVPPDRRLAIAATMGETLARLHALDLEGLGALDSDWGRFFEERVRSVVPVQRERGAPEAWLERLPDYVASRLPLLDGSGRTVFLHADLHCDHVFLDETPAGWSVSGVIDFADARIGAPEYEFGAPGVWIVRDEPRARRDMLLAYGFAERDLDAALTARLASITILHEFFSLKRLLDLYAPDPPATFEELEERLWGVGEC